MLPDQTGDGHVAADLILRNVKIRTLDPAKPEAHGRRHAGAAYGGRDRADAMRHAARRPGFSTAAVAGSFRLIDSHMHVIRGGLNFALELRWDGVPSLADACGC